MAISMVRKPSETPNMNNIDDIIPFRYAYGNQNGYVIGRGAEVSHTVNGNQFTINSGRVVIQGVESDIDANGVTLTIDSVSETRYYVVYYEINLANNTANIKLSNYSTTGYPTIDAGDDLTANSSGIARLPLYRFTAKSGVIRGVEKVVIAIEYSGTALVGYDISKGTVENRFENITDTQSSFEERLTRLGFKTGNITKGSSVVGKVNRQGNYVIGSLTKTGGSITTLFSGSNIPVNFRPKTETWIFLFETGDGGQAGIRISTSGNIEVFDTLGVPLQQNFNYPLIFGYEVAPLT